MSTKEFDQQLERVLQHYYHLRDSLASESIDMHSFAQLSKECADLEPIAEVILKYQNACQELKDLETLLKDSSIDSELKQMAENESNALREHLPQLETDIKIQLLPKDIADERNVIVEVRAGTGGSEAGLFADDLFRMYQRYAEHRGWRFEIIHINTTELGGLREGSASITGRGAFARLKFESGVHRVQRVPATEASGRIHTSTSTVAVLPEAEDVDIKIEEKDLRIDVYRASGAGGQHVNTTDSAVRITHIPTGIVVQQQDERSQHKNKAKALKILRARLFEAQRMKQEAERAANRKTQVGTGERSERIRTYNFPQGRVSDHRINITLYKIDRVLDGSALDELIDPLIADDQARRLAEVSDL